MRSASRAVHASSARGVRAALAAALLAVGCGDGAPEAVDTDYRPTRQDYAAFREGTPGLLEPNYLPFMVRRARFEDAGRDALFFCRWPDAAFPLAVSVQPPVIGEAIADEFDPVPPDAYAAAARRALDTWERELEGAVRFRYVDDPEQASLRLELVGEQAPTPRPDVEVLGSTRLREACRVRGGAPGDARLAVEFAVPALRIFVADRHGLLTPEQVEWVARHEVGHALGMPAHSPIPADLMFERVRDRRQVVFGLSDQDVNSFLDLYRLPNGTVFAWAPAGGQPERPPPPPLSPEPVLAPAPHVDPRLGFEVRLPEGWMRLATPYGVVSADGVAWDYAASFQVVVAPFDTLEAYLARYPDAYPPPGRLRERSRARIGGRRTLRFVVERADSDRVESLTLIESGDGRVFTVIADAPADRYPAYARWFDRVLAGLEIWPAGGG